MVMGCASSMSMGLIRSKYLKYQGFVEVIPALNSKYWQFFGRILFFL